MTSKLSNFNTGWIDTTIHDFLATIEEPPSGMTYALVTSLDSTIELAAFVAHNPSHILFQRDYRLIGDGLLLKTRSLLAADREHRLFFGFDEIWFFPSNEIEPKPDNLIIVGPEKVEPSELESHLEWLEKSKCSLGLGDGTGMNFCLKVRGVAKHIVDALSESYA